MQGKPLPGSKVSQLFGSVMLAQAVSHASPDHAQSDVAAASQAGWVVRPPQVRAILTSLAWQAAAVRQPGTLAQSST